MIDISKVSDDALKKAVAFLLNQYDPTQAERLAILGLATNLLAELKTKTVSVDTAEIDELIKSVCLSILLDPRDSGAVLTAKLKASALLDELLNRERQAEQHIKILRDLIIELAPSDLVGLITTAEDLESLQAALVDYADADADIEDLF